MVRHGRLPRSLMDLETRSATEEARREYLRKLFYRLLERAVAVKPVPYTAMVRGIRGLRRSRQQNR